MSRVLIFKIAASLITTLKKINKNRKPETYLVGVDENNKMATTTTIIVLFINFNNDKLQLFIN